jgi:type II secretory pathway pseudopilin PulG
MKRTFNMFRRRRGFSLAETLASVLIGAMVLVAMLRVYNQAERSAASVRRKIQAPQLAAEVLQRIAEDLDGIVASDADTKVSVENKFIQGYPAARLTIEKTVKDELNKTQVFEKIVWQSSYDFFGDSNGLTLFRSHSGMNLEDKFLDEKRTNIEGEYPLVPICSGVTFFKIQVPRGEELLERWLSNTRPPGLILTLSFAEPFETLQNTLDVPEEEKTVRTFAIDRTRRIKFELGEIESVYDDITDANDEAGGDEEGLDDQEIPDGGEEVPTGDSPLDGITVPEDMIPTSVPKDDKRRR